MSTMSTPQSAAWRWRTIGCLALAAVLTACTAPSPSAAPGAPGARAGPHRPGAGAITHGADSAGTGRPRITVGPIPPTGSRQSVVLPLEAYEQVASQEQDTGLAAFGLLIQRCMQAKGFSYPVAPQPGNSLAELHAVENQPAGITSLARAKAHGYGKPGDLYVPSGRIGLGVFPLILPRGMSIRALHRHPAWASALLGGLYPGAPLSAGPRPGCYQIVQSQLTRGISGPTDPVPGLAAQAAQWAQSDPRVLATQRSWSRCMAARGYSYQTPLQPLARRWPKTPTPAEIATATADVSCKARVNLPNTVLTIEAAYQQALLAQNLPAFTHLQTAFGRLLQRAENLLSPRPARSQLTASHRGFYRGSAPDRHASGGTRGPACS
jgi:hypothetical protein